MLDPKGAVMFNEFKELCKRAEAAAAAGDYERDWALRLMEMGASPAEVAYAWACCYEQRDLEEQLRKEARALMREIRAAA